MSQTLKVLFLVLGFAICNNAIGQDAVYSQFYLSPTILNPAFAGNTRGPFIAVNYRNQWPSIDNAYTTYSVAYDQQWKTNSGIGLYVNSDDAGNGAIKTTKLSAVYSYKVQLGREIYMKGAIEAGYGQTRLDWEQLVFFDELDPQFGTEIPGGITLNTAELPRDNLSKGFFDVGSGILVYNPLWYAGISYKHVNSPTIDFIGDQTGRSGQLPSRITLHGGMQIDLNSGNKGWKDAFISPNALASFQGDFWEVTAGAYLSVGSVFGGLWYRQGGVNRDAVIGSLGVKSGLFKIAYSYDYTISDLSIGSGGSHEIGLSITFKKEKGRDFPYSDCLNLFR